MDDDGPGPPEGESCMGGALAGLLTVDGCPGLNAAAAGFGLKTKLLAFGFSLACWLPCDIIEGVGLVASGISFFALSGIANAGAGAGAGTAAG